MRWLVAWILIGVIVQLAGRIYLRVTLGGRAAEVGSKRMGVTWWAYLIAIPLWPIDLVFRFLPLSIVLRISRLKATWDEALAAVEVDAATHCPDCGEPWLKHEDHGS